jgi:hypothetical protein
MGTPPHARDARPGWARVVSGLCRRMARWAGAVGGGSGVHGGVPAIMLGPGAGYRSSALVGARGTSPVRMAEAPHGRRDSDVGGRGTSERAVALGVGELGRWSLAGAVLSEHVLILTASQRALSNQMDEQASAVRFAGAMERTGSTDESHTQSSFGSSSSSATPGYGAGTRQRCRNWRTRSGSARSRSSSTSKRSSRRARSSASRTRHALCRLLTGSVSPTSRGR